MTNIKQYNPKVVVLFCKNFPEVVRRIQNKKPLPLLETGHSFVEGFWDSFGNTAMTALPQESSNFINAMIAHGYTVTALFRLSDSDMFVPFVDEFEKLAAIAVNDKILGKLFLENLPN